MSWDHSVNPLHGTGKWIEPDIGLSQLKYYKGKQLLGTRFVPECPVKSKETNKGNNPNWKESIWLTLSPNTRREYENEQTYLYQRIGLPIQLEYVWQDYNSHRKKTHSGRYPLETHFLIYVKGRLCFKLWSHAKYIEYCNVRETLCVNSHFH